MRTAYLSLVVLLAGGAAWGQTVGISAQPGQRTEPRVFSAPTLRGLTILPEPTARIPQRKTLRSAPGLLLAPAGRADSAISNPEAIPTQWPQAKLEPIPTHWPKVTVELVGGWPARSAQQRGGPGLGTTVVPK